MKRASLSRILRVIAKRYRRRSPNLSVRGSLRMARSLRGYDLRAHRDILSRDSEIDFACDAIRRCRTGERIFVSSEVLAMAKAHHLDGVELLNEIRRLR